MIFDLKKNPNNYTEDALSDLGIKQHHIEELLNITCSFYTALKLYRSGHLRFPGKKVFLKIVVGACNFF